MSHVIRVALYLSFDRFCGSIKSQVIIVVKKKPCMETVWRGLAGPE